MWWFSRAIIRSHRLSLLLAALVLATGLATVAVALDQLGRLNGQAATAADARAGASDLDVDSLLRGGFSSSEVSAIGGLHGVQRAVPYQVATVSAQASDQDLTGTEVRVTGVIDNSVALRPLDVVAGRLPSAGSTDEVALDQSLAADFVANGIVHPLTLGEPIRLTTLTGPVSYTIVGLVAGSSGLSPFSAGAVYMPDAALVSGFPDAVSTPLVALKLAPGTDTSALGHAIEQAVSSATTVDPRASTGAPLGEIQPATGVIDGLAVLITGVLVALSLSLLLGGHRRDMALLRSAGARPKDARRALRNIVLVVILAGVVIGVLAATVIDSLIAGHRVIDLAALFIGAAIAIVAAAVAAVVSVGGLLRRAPLESLAEAPDVEQSFGGRSGALIGVGVVLLLVGIASITTNVSGIEIAGLVAIAAATALLAPHVGAVLVTVLAAVISPIAHRARPAANDLRRERVRLGGAIAVLALGATAAVATGGFGVAVIDAGQSWTQSLFVGQGVMHAPVVQSDAIAANINSAAGVSTGELRGFTELINGLPENMEAVDVGFLAPQGGLDLVSGTRADVMAELGAGGPVAVVSQSLADSNGWGVGTRITAAGPAGPVQLTVVGIAAHTFPAEDGRETVVMGLTGARAAFGADAAGFNALEVGGSLSDQSYATLAQRFGMSWTTTADIENEVHNAVVDAIGLLLATTTVATVLGLAGAIAAILTATRRRSRDIALLRAIGLSRAAVRARLRFYALWLAVAAVGPGMAAGVAVGAVCASLASSAALQVSLAPNLLLVAAVGAAIIVLVAAAAYFPAQRAASRDVVRAIARE